MQHKSGILIIALLSIPTWSYAVIDNARIFTKTVGAKNKVIILLSDNHYHPFDSQYWDARQREVKQLPFLVQLLRGKNIPILIEYPDPREEIGGWKAIAQNRIEKNKSLFMLEVARDAHQKGIPVIYSDIRGTFNHIATTMIDIRIAFSLNPLNWNFMEYYCDTLGYYIEQTRTNLGKEIDAVFTYAEVKKDLDKRLQHLKEAAKELTFLDAGEQAIVTEIINNYVQQINNRYSKLISNLSELGMTNNDFNISLEALYESLGHKLADIYSKFLTETGSIGKSSLQLQELYNYTYASAPLADAGLILAMIQQLQSHNGVAAIIGAAHADNLVQPLGKLGYRLVAEGQLTSDQITKAIACTMPALSAV